MSSPRRPRLRFIESAESATICNSWSTNCGTTSVPSRNPVSAMSAIRPSMMTLVSRIFWFERPSASAAEEPAERRKIEQIAFRRPGDRADIGKQEQAHHLRKVKDVRIGGAGLTDHQAYQRGAEQPRDHPEHHAEQALEADARDPALEDDRRHSKRRAHQRRGPERRVRRAEVPRGDAEN